MHPFVPLPQGFEDVMPACMQAGMENVWDISFAAQAYGLSQKSLGGGSILCAQHSSVAVVNLSLSCLTRNLPAYLIRIRSNNTQ